MLHCSPQMLHFQGLLSEWQPLWRKYKVWSGKFILQKRQVKPEPEPCDIQWAVEISSWSFIIVELVFVDSIILFAFLLWTRADILLLRSSRSNDFKGETCNLKYICIYRFDVLFYLKNLLLQFESMLVKP